MPSLCSSRSTFMPGVVALDDERLDRRAALATGRASPRRRSASARSPEVTKIFSPLRTYSSPSSSAVVRIAAESEPASGSVIAIAAHLPPKRSSCSSLATDGDRGVAEALARHRQQQADVAPAHLHDAEHGRRGWCRCGCRSLVVASLASRRTPAGAGAAELAAARSCPSISAASMSSSFGYACSAWSYLREIGRSISVATWWAWLDQRLELLRGLEIDHLSSVSSRRAGRPP